MFALLNEEYSFSELFSGKVARFLKGGVITDSLAFKKWFGESKVVDESGSPLIVYHGTTHPFNIFTTERSNIENDFGKAYYFSSNKTDAETNYNAEGQDITTRVERLSERLQNEEELSETKAKQKAKKLLVGKSEKVLPVFLSIQNPLIIGGAKESYLGLEMDEYGDNASGKLYEFTEGLRRSSYKYNDVNIDEVISSIFENHLDGDRISRILDTVKKNEKFMYASDDEGNLASNELIREAVASAGYDGIIDHTVSRKWGTESGKMNYMQGVSRDTTHYIVWNSTQIKSATDNNGKFDPKNPDIRFDIGGLFHGSPSDFCDTKFSLDKIGSTTEQTNMGWGVYFTNERQIAEAYASIPSAKNLISFDEALKLTENGKSVFGKFRTFDKDNRSYTAVKIAKTPQEVIEHKDYRWFNEVETLNVYRVTLHKGKSPDQYDYVEYELTDNQLDKIKRQARKENIDLQVEQWRLDFVYNRLSEILGGDKYASLFFLRSGIDGIKYPCQMTDAPRVKNIGHCFNYVVFDAENISIEECIKLIKNV